MVGDKYPKMWEGINLLSKIEDLPISTMQYSLSLFFNLSLDLK